MFDERDFYSNNPELAEHKEAIKLLTLKGNSLEDAALLVKAKDSTTEARENSRNSNFTNWSTCGWTRTYSQDDLYKLPHAEKMQALRAINSGKAIETS